VRMGGGGGVAVEAFLPLGGDMAVKGRVHPNLCL
jgi:hypothetical protein